MHNVKLALIINLIVSFKYSDTLFKGGAPNRRTAVQTVFEQSNNIFMKRLC